MKSASRIFGIVLIIIGLLGFIPHVTSHELLLHTVKAGLANNILALVIGVISLLVSMAPKNNIRLYFQLIGPIFGIIAIAATMVGPGNVFGFIPNNTATTWLYIVLGIYGLYFGFSGIQTQA